MFEFTDVEGLDVPRLICHDVQHHGACNAIPLLTHTHTHTVLYITCYESYTC